MRISTVKEITTKEACVGISAVGEQAGLRHLLVTG
jgi:hypothetical protein